MKRLFDFLTSLIGILILSPIFISFMFLVFLQDFKNPFYIAPRVGLGGKPFRMVKLRSMVVNADKTGLASTSNNDMRITTIGKIIRKYKLDELTQLFNVFVGSMSLVGPRPNVSGDVALYTDKERELLSVKPGITDFASIVFSDEGDILSLHEDADKAYQQLIRPGKGALGIFYIRNRSFKLDIQLIILTILAIINKEKTLQILSRILDKMNADPKLVKLVLRNEELKPEPPLGSKTIFTGR